MKVLGNIQCEITGKLNIGVKYIDTYEKNLISQGYEKYLTCYLNDCQYIIPWSK